VIDWIDAGLWALFGEKREAAIGIRAWSGSPPTIALEEARNIEYPCEKSNP
jgi:hypothetical protein